jgi:alpha/beta superfamily hydrolase
MMKVFQDVVKGYKGELSNVLIENVGEKLAIFFPGIGYNNDMPLLYYSAKLLGELGFDILRVNYRYNNEDFNKSSNEEKRKWIQFDVSASINHFLETKGYTQIVLVCKSIGTLAGLESLKSHKHLSDAKVIWLTPLTHNEQIVSELKEIDNESLVIIGTKDPCYVPENVEQIDKLLNYKIITCPDTDHSLEISGDIIGSISVMEGILKNIQSFLGTSR